MKIKLLFCFLLATFTSLLFAHSGGTDSSGGHYNRSTGSYHYHNSGYSSSSSYSGNCPCPYSTAADGSRCGARSAWSRSGGHSPVCYKSDTNSSSTGQSISIKIPANASLNYFGDDWDCNRGFYKYSGACHKVKIPANGKLNIYGDGWVCNTGFYKYSGACHKVGE